MKLNKRTGAILGFLLAVVGGATAATGWLTNYTWTYDTLKKEPIPAVLVTDDDDGTWTTVKTGTGLTVNGTITASTAGLATSANQDAERTLEGALTETAPGTDTASSGINGRLQRIAQRLTSLIELDPGKCANPWITTIDTTSGADTSLALTGCVSGTCKRVVIDNIGSNPVLIQVNSSTGTNGLWLAPATTLPAMQHSADLSFGPAVTALYKSTTGATAPAAYGTIGASETVVSACD